MDEMALKQTERVHKALRNLVREVLPAYEPDDGPLTQAQHATISKIANLTIIEDDMDLLLFT